MGMYIYTAMPLSLKGLINGDSLQSQIRQLILNRLKADLISCWQGEQNAALNLINFNKSVCKI